MPQIMLTAIIIITPGSEKIAATETLQTFSASSIPVKFEANEIATSEITPANELITKVLSGFTVLNAVIKIATNAIKPPIMKKTLNMLICKIPHLQNKYMKELPPL